ncbi:hypothetical protein HC891_05560 [Candidatus Gracilibacteria bacterium]|nr:hypothetical protein [Candidatus Gracilibacteria bacterium]
MSAPFAYTISYGKVAVPVYRMYAAPLRDLPALPESSFSGRANIVFAAEIDVEIFGDDFLPAYTYGDNTMVVATDTMKNFILRESLTYAGATLEGLLDHLGRGFLARYPVMPALRISGRELPFRAVEVPQGTSFGASELVFTRDFRRFQQRHALSRARARYGRAAGAPLWARAAAGDESQRQRFYAFPARRLHHIAGTRRSPALYTAEPALDV